MESPLWTTIRKRAGALAFIPFLSCPFWAQESTVRVPAPAEFEIMANMQKLECKLTLDPDSYLPRETARATITIRNPTRSPLQVLTPPQPPSRMLFVARVGDDGSEHWVMSDDVYYPTRF